MKRLKGPVAFDEFYGGHYGERWQALKAALCMQRRHVALANPFSKDGQWAQGCERFSALQGEVFVKLGEWPSPESMRGLDGLSPYYLMDAASVACAQALQVLPGQRVLDLCAAPGGKSLVLAFTTPVLEHGTLTSNDRSAARRARLRRVLEEYLPSELAAKVKVTGHDAARWCLYEKNAYDRVLLDAPCSSERHLLEQTVPADWSKGRSERLAREQWTMLAGAFEVLKDNGRLVYATCSLSPLENDEVVAKLIETRQGRVHCLDPGIPFGERTQWGTMVLPDNTGWGPLYVSVVEKRGE